MGRLRNHYRWTPEMVATLTELYGTCPAKEIAEIINAKYGTGFTPTAIYNRAVMKELRSYSSYHYYTEEQDEWLRQNVSKYLYDDLTREFNKEFQAHVDYKSVRNRCQAKGFKFGNPYTKGYHNHCYTPVGSEYISSRGAVYVKVSDVKTKGNPFINWKRKSHLVWEQHHGEIPEGHVIVHLDGDPTNCDISNLECTTNSINGQ